MIACTAFTVQRACYDRGDQLLNAFFFFFYLVGSLYLQPVFQSQHCEYVTVVTRCLIYEV